MTTANDIPAVTATIDLSAIQHNLSVAKSLAPDADVMAVIKADGYGHGLLQVASALSDADALAVARLDEAVRLRDNDSTQRIILLGGAWDEEALLACAQYNVDLVIHNFASIELIKQATLEKPIHVWLKIDSGMHRLGIQPSKVDIAVKTIQQCKNVSDYYFMTHFSDAEVVDNTVMENQIETFNHSIENQASKFVSLSNSAAIIKQYTQKAEWVRPGIMLYGANPLPKNIQSTYPVSLKPAMTLTAPVIAIRKVKAGEYVGYNRRWQAQRDSLIATIAIGYGDGYPRHAKNGTPVLIKGQFAKLAGTVSMDLITVDITDCDEIAIGDQAELWGKQLLAEDVANWADTISYELFTSVSDRVIKNYTRL